jgi:uncharacterized protein (TIGR02466 family)
MPSNGQLDSGLNQLFPTLIWRANAYADSDLSGIDSKVNAAIATAVRDACARDRAFKPADYPNGYTTYSSRFPLREDPRCAPLLYWILREAQVYFQHVGVLPGWRPVIADFFGTIGRQWSHHGAHRHENSEVSGVYYPKADAQSAALTLHSPLEPLQMASRHELFKPGSQWSETERLMPPRTGNLILFPSWLEHAVEVQREFGERIAISVNIRLERTYKRV